MCVCRDERDRPRRPTPNARGFAMCKFTVGQHVVVNVPNSPRPFNATVTRVIAADSKMGGLFKIAPHFAKIDADADIVAGDWLEPIPEHDHYDGAVFAHPSALVAIGGGY